MGTHSITIFYDEYDQKPICAFYRQMDGYLSGHGAELKENFGDFEIINGISGGDNSRKANGMGCFAAQVIAHVKEGIGGIYMISSPKQTEEYNYHISCKPDGQVRFSGDEGKLRIWVRVTDWKKKEIYSGWLSHLPTDED